MIRSNGNMRRLGIVIGNLSRALMPFEPADILKTRQRILIHLGFFFSLSDISSTPHNIKYLDNKWHLRWIYWFYMTQKYIPISSPFFSNSSCHMTFTNCKIKQFFTLPSVDVPLLHCNPIKGTEYVAFIF